MTILTDEELTEFSDMFPDLPSHEHQPYKFMHYVRMYKYIKFTREQEVPEEDTPLQPE